CAHDRGKVAHELRVNLALEPHDQPDELVELRPAPGIEFAWMPSRTRDHDFLLVPEKAHREPLLALPAVAPAPGLGCQVARPIVTVPAGAFREDGDRGDPGLLLELAQRRGPRILIEVDAALRHLPPAAGAFGLARRVVASTDPNLAPSVEQHDAHAG